MLIRKIGILLLILISLLSGCMSNPINESNANVSNHGYSFDNPDIIAYINGEPISQEKMNNYITMKKAYKDVLEKQIERFIENHKIELTSKLYLEYLQEQKQEIESFSEDDWVNDYYKSIFICNLYYDVVKDDYLIDYNADCEIQNVMSIFNGKTDLKVGMQSDDYGEITKTMVDDPAEYAVPAIQTVADELGMSFEECAHNVYIPFFRVDQIYPSLLFCIYDELDYGEIVEYDGSNASEYEAFMEKVKQMNKEYLNSLFSKAEIVEKH